MPDFYFTVLLGRKVDRYVCVESDSLPNAFTFARRKMSQSLLVVTPDRKIKATAIKLNPKEPDAEPK